MFVFLQVHYSIVSNSYSVIRGLNCEIVIRDGVRSGYFHQAIASELPDLRVYQ